MNNKFYILYGYKQDEYGKLKEYSEIGHYSTFNDLQRAINEYSDTYSNFVYKEDYINDAFTQIYIFGSYIPTASDSICGKNNIKYYNEVDAKFYSPITYNIELSKPIIICIVGASGSGKTTLSLHLQEHYNVPAICSYTTRPMREGETDGIEHKFVTEFNIENKDNLLAYTLYGGYHYWTTHNQIKNSLVTYVIDKRGLDEFKTKWADRYKIVSVLINRSKRDSIDNNRKLRDLDNPTTGEYDIEITNDFDNLTDFFNHAVDKITPFIKKIRC